MNMASFFKHRGLGILAFVSGFFAIAYGQSCQLLPWRTPSTLADGQSRTGYKIPEATYTTSCDEAVGQVTCVSGSLAYGNIFKYPSCIPHTRANCTTPTWAQHLEYRFLYKSPTNTYTESCQLLGQHLQCLNGVFTGWVTPWLYTYATCTDQVRRPCIDQWTTPPSYKNHGETLLAYRAPAPTPGNTCQTLRVILTCIDSVRSGNGTQGQQWLFTGCVQSTPLSGCIHPWTNAAIPHGYSFTAYTSPQSPGTGTCEDVARPIVCINGVLSGYQAGLFSGCTPSNMNPCSKAAIGLGSGTIPHGMFVTKFTQPRAFLANNQWCNDFRVSLQCLNGTWSGNTAAAYTWCQEITSWACHNTLTDTYVSPWQYAYVYNNAIPQTPYGCENEQVQLLCGTGQQRYTDTWIPLGTSIPNSYQWSCSWCMLPWGTLLPEWSQVLAYSTPSTAYPKTCTDFSTLLVCSGWMLQGNRQRYHYPSCSGTQLISWVDIAINTSPLAHNVLVAQWSSPEVTITFSNNGNTAVAQQITQSGFLTCTRTDASQPITIYTSRPIKSFVLNPGSTMSVGIRLNSVFTNSLWVKTLECTIDTSKLSVADQNPTNNTLSLTF